MYKVEICRNGVWEVKEENIPFSGWAEVARYVKPFVVPMRVTGPDGKVRNYKPDYSGGLRPKFIGCRLVKE